LDTCSVCAVEVVGFILAIVGFGLAAGLWFRAGKQADAAQRQQADLESKLVEMTTRSESAEKKATQFSSRAQQLEVELSEAIARRDEKAMASAMWELELERTYRQWYDIIAPSKVDRLTDVGKGRQLTFALSQEVERLREEVGVSIKFDGEIALEMEAETALGVLRIGEELLALTAKQADEVLVRVEEGDEPSVSLILDCSGWEGGEGKESEIGRTIGQMAEKLDGWVRWQSNSDDGLVITVRVPAPLPNEPKTD
jgi:hypothetical protein